MSWQDYGWPDITFLPSYLPMAGLQQALTERALVFGAGGGEDGVWPPPELLDQADGRGYAAALDRVLDDILVRYVDHLRLDLAELTDIPRWSRARLMEELGQVWIDPERDMLRPEFYLAWAQQRRAVIDLLRYVEIEYAGTSLSGSVHTGEPKSPEAAIAAAQAAAQVTIDQRYPAIARTVTTIWGPDHGWDDGSYCADVYQVGMVRANLAADSTAPVLLYVYFDSPDGERGSFDAFGTGIWPGMRSFASVGVAPFFDWPLPGEADRVRVPAAGRSESFGFTARRIACFADYNTIFKFHGDDQA